MGQRVPNEDTHGQTSGQTRAEGPNEEVQTRTRTNFRRRLWAIWAKREVQTGAKRGHAPFPSAKAAPKTSKTRTRANLRRCLQLRRVKEPNEETHCFRRQRPHPKRAKRGHAQIFAGVCNSGVSKGGCPQLREVSAVAVVSHWPTTSKIFFESSNKFRWPFPSSTCWVPCATCCAFHWQKVKGAKPSSVP